jgi:hypothetical protein
MSLSVIAQLASAAINLLFVVIIAIGYFMMIRLYRQMVAVYDRMLGLMESESTSLGRPLATVMESALDEVDRQIVELRADWC